jgi:hypothetical protein
MRYTDSTYEEEFGLQDSVNILSVNIVSSDVGFPVNVYGSVIARDSIDYKCIYLFHRHRDECQPIKLKVHSYSKKLLPTGFLFDLTMHFISIDIEQLMESSYIELVVVHRDSHIP